MRTMQDINNVFMKGTAIAKMREARHDEQFYGPQLEKLAKLEAVATMLAMPERSGDVMQIIGGGING